MCVLSPQESARAHLPMCFLGMLRAALKPFDDSFSLLLFLIYILSVSAGSTGTVEQSFDNFEFSQHIFQL
jgi:hypothetical protein